MTSSRNATTYYIASGALSMVENALDNPNRIAVSITNGAAMLVHISGIIDYAVDGNYRKWSITAYNTRLADTGRHIVYARLSRTTQQGMIIFSTRDYDIEGQYTEDDGTQSGKSQEYYFIPIGEVSATDDRAEALREIFLDFGLLSTDKGMTSSSDMFRVNPVTGMIEALRTFASATFQTLTIAKRLILGDKSVSGIAGDGDILFDEDGWMIADGSSLVSDAGLKKALDTGYVSKLHDDTVKGKIGFEDEITAERDIKIGGSLTTKDFKPEVSGSTFGRYRDTQDTYIEIDRLYVRKIAEFVELQIQKLSHVGGQIELSPCASSIKSVEVLDDGSFKCYLLLEDGERRITNDWVVGDQAKRKTFNIAENRNKYYWRLVTEVGEDYIVLSLNDCDISSGMPEPGDDIIQSGNRTDPARQNVIVLSAHGLSSPSIAQYMGIDSYTLLDKEVIFMGYDDAVKAVVNRTYGQFYVGDRDSENGSFIHYTPDGGVEMRATKFSLKVKDDSGQEKYEELDKIISQIGGQDDGSFLVWRTDSLDEPNEYSEPAIQWTTDEERMEHVGDIYLNADGLCWEYAYIEGVGFYWKPVTDKYLIQCVNRIETKARVFTGVYGSTTPTTGEYHVNDMWVDATFGTQYVKDMLVCIKAGSWESFKIEDWKPSNRFSEALSNFINGDYKEFVDQMEQREDRYAETFYQSEDPSLLWDTDEERQKHVGDIWYDTTNKASKIFNGTDWDTSDIDLSDITDKVDGKNKIFVSKPNVSITTDDNYCYRVNDIWIVESDSAISGYKKGEILVALQSSTVYNASHWSRKVSYTDGMNESEKQNLSETGIDIQKKEITLTAGKTLIRSNDNTTIAMFTLKNGIPYFKTSLIDADEIDINVVKSYDRNGTLLSAYNGNGNGTIIYYYPNGSVMKEDVWLKDANGNTTGIRQIYYMANGEVAWYIDQNGFQSRLQEYWKDAGIWGFVLTVGYNASGSTSQQKAQAIASYVALHYSAWIPIEDTDNLSWWETYVGSTTYNEYQGLAIKGNIDSGEVPHDGMRGIFTGWALQGSVSGGKIYPYEFYLDDEDTAYVGFYAVYYSNSRLQAYYYITTDGHVYDVPNSRMAR